MNYTKRSLNIIILACASVLFFASASFAAKAMTVLGPISPDKMGVTLSHEHINFAYPGYQADASVAPYDQKVSQKNWMDVNKTWKKYGVKTVVCPDLNDTGHRDPIAYRNVAKATGINAIIATGLYWEGEGNSRYFKYLGAAGLNMEDAIYDMFLHELTKGIGKTGVKAGLVKISTGDPEISDYEKTVMRAAVRAAKEANVPITTHCQGSTVGIKQMEYFLSLGADPKKIIIGHQNNSADLNYHLEQLKNPGFFIGFDRISLMNVPKSEENMIELIKMGYADRIVMSHDFPVTWPGRKTDPITAFKADKWSPFYIFKTLIPNMKAAGITDAQIKQIMVDNPRRLFAEDWAK